MVDLTGRTDPIDLVERLAVGASLACIVHCLMLPLLIAALPALMSVLAIPESVHRWLLVCILPMAGVALIHGRSRHRLNGPLALGIGGLVLLAAGALVFDKLPTETLFTVAGSLLLSSAHVWNWRMRHAC